MLLLAAVMATAAAASSRYIRFECQRNGVTYDCSFTLYDTGEARAMTATAQRADADAIPTLLSLPRAVTSPDYPDVEFPVEAIGAGAFAGCGRLRSLDLGATGITTIGQRAFAECSQLRSVTLPASLVALGTRAFSKCSALTRADLPAELKELGLYVFEQCAALSSVAIPAGLDTFGSYLLDGCSSITTVVCKLPAPELKALGLPDAAYAAATLYVPAGRAALYSAVPDWNRFGHIVEAGDVNADDSLDSADVSVLLEMVLAGGVADGVQLMLADVNADGALDSADVAILLELVLSGR